MGAGLSAAPYGHVPYGALPGGADGSVPSPVGTLLAGDLDRVEQLLIVYPKIAGEATPFYFCVGMGDLPYFASNGADTFLGAPLAHQPFPPIIIEALSFRERILDRGQPVDGVTAYGTIRVGDPGRELPFADDSCDWTNARFYCLQGSPKWPLSGFAVVQRGYVERCLPIEQGGRAWDFALRDELSLLRESAAPQLYRGTGFCLDFDGGDDRVDIADAAAIRITGDLTISATIWPRTLAFGTIAGRGNTSYRFRVQPDGSLWTLVNDGSGFHVLASPPGVVVGGMVLQDVATTVTFGGGTCTVRWYVGTATTPMALVGSATAPIASLAAAVGNGLYVGGSAAPIGETLDGRMDEFMLWSRALSIEELEANRQREIPGDSTDLAVYLRFNEGDLTTAADATPNGCDGTLVNGPRWVGSLEGGPELAGRRKPVGRGIIRHRELVWVDGVGQVGQFDSHPAEEVLLVTVGGLASFDFHANVTDVYDAEPPAGTYDVDLARGLIRFGGTRPDRTVLVDFRADSRGGYVETTGAICRRHAEEAGVAVDAIDDGGFAAVDILHPGPVGIGANGDDATFDSLILALMHGVYGWRATDIGGRVTVGALDFTGGSMASIDGGLELAAQGREPVDRWVPPSRIEVLYRRYEKTLSRGELAADDLSESQIRDFGEEFRVYQTATISTAKGAKPLVLTTCFDEEADAKKLADLLLPVLSGRPVSDTLTLSRPSHGWATGGLITVTADLPGYELGRDVVIAGIDLNDQTGVHRLDVFG